MTYILVDKRTNQIKSVCEDKIKYNKERFDLIEKEVDFFDGCAMEYKNGEVIMEKIHKPKFGDSDIKNRIKRLYDSTDLCYSLLFFPIIQHSRKLFSI